MPAILKSCLQRPQLRLLLTVILTHAFLAIPPAPSRSPSREPDSVTTQLPQSQYLQGHSSPSVSLDAITCSPTGFVEFLSRINVKRWGCDWEVNRAETKEQRESYHSRDQATTFKMQCPTTWKEYQCGFISSNGESFRRHLKECSVERLEKSVPAAAAAAKGSKIPAPKYSAGRKKCSYDDYSKSYPTNDRLAIHIEQVHEWTPKQCDKEGCEEQTLFPSGTEYNKHLRIMRDDKFKKGPCTVCGCRSQNPFTNAKAYANNLRKYHGLNQQARQPYMKERKENFRVIAAPARSFKINLD